MLFCASNAVMLLALLCLAAAYVFVLVWRVVSLQVTPRFTVGDLLVCGFYALFFGGAAAWVVMLCVWNGLGWDGRFGH